MSFRNHNDAAMYDANGTPIYGMDLELKQKQMSKYDPQKEADVRNWLEAVLKEKLNGNLQAALKNGQVLCRLANTLQPGIIPKVNKMAVPFMEMENISWFLDAIQKLGVKKHDSFVTVDLYENKNMNQVIECLLILASVCQKLPNYKGPIIGVKLAEEKKIQFSEQQLRSAANEASFFSVASKKVDVGKSIKHDVVKTQDGGDRGSVSQASVASNKVDVGKSIKHEVVKTKDGGDRGSVSQSSVASNKVDVGKSIAHEVVKTKDVGDSNSVSQLSVASKKVDVGKSIANEVVKVQGSPAAAPASNAGSKANYDEIAKLHDLYQKGILTKDEFEAKKKQLLGL